MPVHGLEEESVLLLTKVDHTESFYYTGFIVNEYTSRTRIHISHMNTHLVNDYPISYTNTPILHTKTTHLVHNLTYLAHDSTHLAHDYFCDNSAKLELKARNPVQQSDLPSRIFVVIMCKKSRSP